MKLGICTDAEQAAWAKAAGCDYIEMGFTKTARQSEAEFCQAQRDLEAAAIPCETMNRFLPGEFALCASPDVPALKAFLGQGFARAAQLGVQVVVFGAGAARRPPEGMRREEAWRLLAPYFRLAAEYGAAQGIALVIEPLRRGECGAVNTLREGLALMELVDHPNLHLLADLYHMGENGEDLRDVCLAGERLRHCHMGRPVGRFYPLPGDGFDYTPFFDALRDIGYAGRCSIEAKPPHGPEDLAVSVGYLREIGM